MFLELYLLPLMFLRLYATTDENTIHTFTSSGTFQVTNSSLTEVEVLIVGGGGGGRGYYGGGGGGGEVVYTSERAVSIKAYNVTVGQGGDGDDFQGTDGGSSFFDDVSAIGGRWSSWPATGVDTVVDLDTME